MPLKLQKVNTDEIWFTPDVKIGEPGDDDFWSNREDKDPFQVKIRPLNAVEMETLKGKGMIRLSRLADKATDDDFYAYAQNVRDNIIGAAVLEVKNLEIGDEHPTDGESLVKAVKMGPPGTIDLVLDNIIAALQDHSQLSEELQGESESQSEQRSNQNQKSGSGAAISVSAKNGQAPTSTTTQNVVYETVTDPA